SPQCPARAESRLSGGRLWRTRLLERCFRCSSGGSIDRNGLHPQKWTHFFTNWSGPVSPLTYTLQKYEGRSNTIKLASAAARCMAGNLRDPAHVESNRRENRTRADAAHESTLERCNADYAARSCNATAPARRSPIHDDLRFRGSRPCHSHL